MNPNLFCGLAAALLMHTAAYAQLKSPQYTALRTDLQKVVAEYPLQFAAIRGPIVDRNPQSTEYRSTLSVSGAERCSIVAYSSDGPPVYSWQALMLTTEDYEAAARKYKALFQQLRGSNIYYVKDQYTLRGTYQEADESRGFATSTLALVRPPERFRKLRVEVSLQFEFPEWKVQLHVFEKEKEDDVAYEEE